MVDLKRQAEQSEEDKRFRRKYDFATAAAVPLSFHFILQVMKIEFFFFFFFFY